MSTAMTQKATEKYADKILWKIKVPAGTKGASIESFNIERDGEAEFLMQRGTSLLIEKGQYEPKNKKLCLEGKVEQLDSIDNNTTSVKMEIGV